MKHTLIALLLAMPLAFPLAALANSTPVNNTPPPRPRLISKPVPPAPVPTSSVSSAASSAAANAGAYSGGNSVGLTASPQLEFSTAQAPDVISYPTAPCRISVGASAGWFGGAVGVSGSVEDESCALGNLSTQLYNIGQKAAAVQVMCLSDNARKALEAVGTTCIVRKQEPQPEYVKP